MTFTASNITIPAQPMVGDELLSFVKRNGNLSKTEMAQATGYVSTTKDGALRCNITAMTDALVQATGIVIGGASSGRGPGGRKLSYTARVQGNKNLLVGAAYTKQLGLEPGAEFDIKISKQTGTIRLIPVGTSEEEAE